MRMFCPGNTITDNAPAALDIGNLSVFKSGQSSPSSDPADGDIILQKGCAKGQTADECEMTATTDYGIDCYRRCLVDMRNGNITGLSSFSNSQFTVRHGTINGHIEAGGLSSINFRRQRQGDTGVTGSGELRCGPPVHTNGTLLCGEFIETLPKP